jgi:hypothetical protein
MNGKQAKRLRKVARQNMIDWFNDQLPDEQRGTATEEDILRQIPQSYVYSMRTARHSAFSYKWFYRAAKMQYKYA